MNCNRRVRRTRAANVASAAGGYDRPRSAHTARADRIRLIESELSDARPLLRFSPAVETEFRAYAQRPRARQSVGAAGVGVAIYLAGIALDPGFAPALAGSKLLGVLAIVLLPVAISLMIGLRWRRPNAIWPREQIITATALTIAFACLHAGLGNTEFERVTHTFALVPIMAFVTLIARQRFVYALLTTGALGAMLVWATAPTNSVLGLILRHNLMLFVMAAILALAANYIHERRQRRRFLHRELDGLRMAQLRHIHNELEALARTDALTGIGNRRRFDATLAQACRIAGQAGTALTLVLIDLDHFKAYNDGHGHPAGDGCLARVAGLLDATATEAGASAYRIGGEEFALLLPGRDRDEALALADRVVASVRALALDHAGPATDTCLTASAGVAGYQHTPDRRDSPDALIERADVALYRAKSAGRNRAVFADERRTAPDRRRRSALQSAPCRDTPPAAEPAAGDSDDLEPALARAAGARALTLRLPPRLEWLYIARRKSKRPYELALSVLVGTVVYNVYSYFGRALVPDIAGLVDTWHMIASALLVMIALSCAARINPWLREAVHAAGLMAIAAGSIWICAQSTLATASTYAAAAILIPFFGVVVGRMPYRYTLALLGVTPIAYAVIMMPLPPPTGTAVARTVVLMGLLSLFIAIAGYEIERGARQSFVDRLAARQQTARLRAASHCLWRLSGQDTLTGIGNRRQFDADLDGACAQAVGGHGVGLLFIDIDDFKQYNDLYGHCAGDQCLSEIGRTLAALAAQHGARAYRVGGEEFALLLYGDRPSATRVAAEGIRSAVAELRIPHTASRAADTVSASIGGSHIMIREPTAREILVACADRALYVAKRNGRNRSEFASADADAA